MSDTTYVCPSCAADVRLRDALTHRCPGFMPDAPAGDATETTNPAPISSRLGVGDALMAARQALRPYVDAFTCEEEFWLALADELRAARAEGAAERDEEWFQAIEVVGYDSKRRILKAMLRSPSSGTEAAPADHPGGTK